MSYLSKVFSRSNSLTPASQVGNVRFRGACCFSHTTPAALPLKAGTPVKGFDFFKEKDPVLALERNEYPEWVDKLATPLPSLAKLRRMKEGDADDKLKRRYLKLNRRMLIKDNNTGMAK